MMKFLRKVAYKIARRKFVKGFDKYVVGKPKGRVLLYNKTEEYLLQGFLQDFSHPNNWEAYEMGKILNRLGYVVDVLDRTADLADVEKYIRDDYDLLIGLGAGDSGRYFADIAERVPRAKKVLYAMGPEPDLSNTITKARYQYFRERHPDIPIRDRRLIENVDTARLYKTTDAIITIGNEFSVGSYAHLGKPLHKIYLSTYPGLSFDESEYAQKDQKKFLYFGGNGNGMKGLDLVLEVFEKRPDLQLLIGAPTTEEDFNVFAEPIMKNSPNIKHLGFVDVTSDGFRQVTAECGYVIMPSSSEGCATSVTTCMRRACVPIVTLESGIENIESFGYLTPGTLEGVAGTINTISKISREEFLAKARATYRESEKYTANSFAKSFENAVRSIMSISM